MRKIVYGGLICALCTVNAAADDATIHGPATAEISVCFTPYEHCSNQIVAAIDDAKTSILVQAYEFTAKPIIDALVRAKNRGIDVKVILDFQEAHQEENSGLPSMISASIPVWIDHPKHTAHSKLIIIDETLVIGGSYNYAPTSENKNAENATFINSAEVAGWYVENWQSRQKVSQPSSGELP